MHTSRNPTDSDRAVGARIRLRRQELRMLQATLGDLLGVTFQQVQKYESGKNRVSASRLARVAKALDVSTTFLLVGLQKEARHGPMVEAEALLTSDAIRIVTAYECMTTRVRQAFVALVEAVAAS